MIKKATAWSVFIYGTFVTLLGLYGYYSAGSVVSLYAGAGIGAFLLVFSLAMFAQRKYGAYGALFLTLLLTGIFAYRYTTTKAIVPAIMAVFSGAMLLFLLTRTSNWKK